VFEDMAEKQLREQGKRKRKKESLKIRLDIIHTVLQSLKSNNVKNKRCFMKRSWVSSS